MNGGRLIVTDVLRDELPQLTADLVIADPPWYEKELCGFLWAARTFCRDKGTVLISVPPEGTRPGIRDEWARVLQWTERLGLTLTDYERGCLPYISPPFERNAFQSAGAEGVHIDWRRGDLVTFTCSRPALCGRPAADPKVTWSDYILEGVRFRLRRSAAENRFDYPELETLVVHDILPSVSRRTPLWQSIDLWTSGNRIFRCKGRFVIDLILSAMEHAEDPVCRVKKSVGSLSTSFERAVSDVGARLWKIVELEKHENQALQQRYETQMDECTHRDSGRSVAAR